MSTHVDDMTLEQLLAELQRYPAETEFLVLLLRSHLSAQITETIELVRQANVRGYQDAALAVARRREALFAFQAVLARIGEAARKMTTSSPTAMDEATRRLLWATDWHQTASHMHDELVATRARDAVGMAWRAWRRAGSPDLGECNDQAMADAIRGEDARHRKGSS